MRMGPIKIRRDFVAANENEGAPQLAEARAAFDVPAPWINRVYLHQMGGTICRIAFGELVQPFGTIFRGAFSMAPADALALADMI